MRFPPGKKARQQIELFSSTSNSLCACSPLGDISQISRSPVFALFAPYAMRAPSRETEYAVALSRSIVGAPPCAETIHTLVSSELQRSGVSANGWALATKLELSGNQAPTSHCVFLVLSPAWETAWMA